MVVIDAESDADQVITIIADKPIGRVEFLAGHETTLRNMEIGRNRSETKKPASQVVCVEHGCGR